MAPSRPLSSGPTAVASTLERPEERYIKHFRIGMVGDHTIATYLEKGWSLAIFCRCCPHMTEWTPPVLLKRFGDKLGLKIADIAPRLVCTDPGCKSRDVAVGPHAYDGVWSWKPSKS